MNYVHDYVTRLQDKDFCGQSFLVFKSILEKKKKKLTDIII